jgi:hypothetical protein
VRALLILCAALPTLVVATTPPARAADDACQVTIPNGVLPPGAPTSGGPWGPPSYGNGRLATVTHGVIMQRPADDGSVSMKFGWLGTREPRQPLRIVGKRLDPLTPLTALRVHERFAARANEGYFDGMSPRIRFWASTVTFSTEGCWRVTGIVGSVRLSVVVLVRARH